MTSHLSLRSSLAVLTLALLSLANVANALYFYLEGSEKKCFVEELPTQTMVTGGW